MGYDISSYLVFGWEIEPIDWELWEELNSGDIIVETFGFEANGPHGSHTLAIFHPSLLELQENKHGHVELQRIDEWATKTFPKEGVGHYWDLHNFITANQLKILKPNPGWYVGTAGG